MDLRVYVYNKIPGDAPGPGPHLVSKDLDSTASQT